MITFNEISHASRVIESLENYAIADAPLDRAGPEVRSDNGEADIWESYSDGSFWSLVFWNQQKDPSRGWGQRHRIYDCYLTEWVARVPGLYWKAESKVLRDQGDQRVESRSLEWTTFTPKGKSDKVAGGIGTLKLSPDTHGYRLATISCGLNASSGIPVLLSAELWDQAKKTHRPEGRYVRSAVGKWQQMGPGWSDRFEAIKGVPQGYLVIESLTLGDHSAPTQFHPFSIMEYEANQSRLYDFVYATVDAGRKDWRSLVEVFFEDYRSRGGRYGRYLTAADIGDPLWEAEYVSPKELRRQSHSGRTNLELLSARIQERLHGRDAIEATLAKLGEICDDNRDLGRYSLALGIPQTFWLTDGSLADNTAAFLVEVQKRSGKLEELIDRIDIDYQDISDRKLS